MHRRYFGITAVVTLAGSIWSGISYAEERLVQPGDTLWSIARTTKPDNLSIRQQAEAIFRNNSHAFADDSMNSLRHGVRLTLPEATSTARESAIQQKHQSAARESETSSPRHTITVIRGVAMDQREVRR